jgi:hypothetical protein
MALASGMTQNSGASSSICQLILEAASEARWFGLTTIYADVRHRGHLDQRTY